jgi:hypothetical protein
VVVFKCVGARETSIARVGKRRSAAPRMTVTTEKSVTDFSLLGLLFLETLEGT